MSAQQSNSQGLILPRIKKKCTKYYFVFCSTYCGGLHRPTEAEERRGWGETKWDESASLQPTKSNIYHPSCIIRIRSMLHTQICVRGTSLASKCHPWHSGNQSSTPIRPYFRRHDEYRDIISTHSICSMNKTNYGVEESYDVISPCCRQHADSSNRLEE